MGLREEFEGAFGWRAMPAEVVTAEQLLQWDSDVDEALWFGGHDWRELTVTDWQQRPCGIGYLSREALAYYLPSILLFAVENPDTNLLAADSVLSDLDLSPSVEGWPDYFVDRYGGMRFEEYEAIKKWLLVMCEYQRYRGVGAAASGPGELFGRAYDTVCLLQKKGNGER